MKVNFTIAVRNPEWYWSKDELEKAGDYRKEWEALNKDKIWKHVPLEEFEVPFDVKDIKEMGQGEFEVRLTITRSSSIDLP